MSDCMPDDQDADLVRELKAKRFPREQLEGLVGRLKNWIYTEHRPFYPEADDLAMEAIEEAYTCIGSFRGASLFFTWLTGIATNLIRKRAEKRKMKPEQYLDEAIGAYTRTDEYARQQKQQAADEQERQLLKWEMQTFREGLDERTERILELRLDHEKSSLEIAGMIGERDDNVRTILSRTFKKLRETLVKRGYADLDSRPAQRQRSIATAETLDGSHMPARSKQATKTKGAVR